ncbi:hypothetical protein L208DRAFT_1144499, partial [Tricholoma matsutake]
PWLWKHNPKIDWKTGKVQMTHCPKECNVHGRKMKKEKRKKREEEHPRKYAVTMEEVEDKKMPHGEPVEELVPKAYHEYLSVFQKKESERMPVQKPWDHVIKMKPGVVLKKSKRLCKGYIQPSKLLQTSPIFFMPKKDRKKRMCTDYRYLNEWTVKNAY